MIERVFEPQKLRSQIRLTDEQLMVQLDIIGLRPYQFDIGYDNEILLRLSYELLKQLVEIQESTPLEFVPVIGTARGRRGHVLAGLLSLPRGKRKPRSSGRDKRALEQ
jgi:hypothetical protein